MFQLPLTRNTFELDNYAVYHELKVFFLNSTCWAWIELHDAAKNGCGAFKAWANHYNGEGKLSKCTAIDKVRLDQFHYKNECIVSFEKCTKIMTKCFNTLTNAFLIVRKLRSYLKSSSVRIRSLFLQSLSLISSFHVITLVLAHSSQSKLLVCMDLHSLSIKMLADENMAFMPLTAGHSKEAMEEARTEVMDVEAKVAMADVVILLQQSMASIFLIPAICL